MLIAASLVNSLASQFRSSKLPLGVFLGFVGEIVIIRFVGDEDVLRQPQARRGVERARHDAQMIAAYGAPEQVTAADAAKSTLGRLRGTIPSKRRILLENEIIEAAIRGGDKIPAGAPALRAVATHNGP